MHVSVNVKLVRKELTLGHITLTVVYVSSALSFSFLPLPPSPSTLPLPPSPPSFMSHYFASLCSVITEYNKIRRRYVALVKGNMQKVGKSGRREGGEGKIISDVILIFIAFLSIINKFCSFLISKKLKRKSSF